MHYKTVKSINEAKRREKKKDISDCNFAEKDKQYFTFYKMF